MVDERSAALGLPVEWRDVTGDPVATAALHARYCDLVVAGQTSPDEADGGLAEELALAVGGFLGLSWGARHWLELGLLADAASPVALFTIGAVLARSQIMAEQDAAHAVPWRDVVPVALTKLFLHPLLVLLAGESAIRLGVPLQKEALTVLVLLAALPSASNVSLLAERFGADNGRIARIILVSTAAAFFTFSGAVGVMVGRV
jgi:hypothetical protein